MKTLNATVEDFLKYIENREIYIYGIGEFYIKLQEKDVYKKIHNRVVGYIDNGNKGEKLQIEGKEHLIHGVEFLKEIKSGIVLICNMKYLREMYEMLLEQKLPDSIECFVMPLIWAVSDGKNDKEIMKLFNKKDAINRIEKKIHCCWFSGEDKPLEYKKCIESWKRVCPDYEIIEWTNKNYDCEKNVFLKQAYQKRKWAFVSDYARLDLVYNYGGIYLDMDVELIKDLDPWLKFKSFFNFGTQHDIDLGSGFGSVKENPLILEMIKLYENKEFCNKDGTPMVWQYVQPAFIKKKLIEYGVNMDGSMQLIDSNLFLPRRYHTAVDDIFLQNFIQSNETRGIHHYNAGWCSQEFTEQRKYTMKLNKIMWKMI